MGELIRERRKDLERSSSIGYHDAYEEDQAYGFRAGKSRSDRASDKQQVGENPGSKNGSRKSKIKQLIHSKYGGGWKNGGSGEDKFILFNNLSSISKKFNLNYSLDRQTFVNQINLKARNNGLLISISAQDKIAIYGLDSNKKGLDALTQVWFIPLPAEQMKDNPTKTPAISTKLSKPKIIGGTIASPLLDPRDPSSLRDDLVFGDLTNEDLANIENHGPRLQKDQTLSDETLFNRFTHMATGDFAMGDMDGVIVDMIEHLRTNKGGTLGKELSSDELGYSVYTNEILNQKVENHSVTQQLFLDIEQQIYQRLDDNIHPDDIMLESQELTRPVFDSTADLLTGLFIAIHDIQAFDVKLNQLEVKENGEYTGSITLTIYDHFGLDRDDLDITLSQNWGIDYSLSRHAGFNAWFRLQREREYRPFVTRVDITKTFSGKIKNE